MKAVLEGMEDTERGVAKFYSTHSKSNKSLGKWVAGEYSPLIVNLFLDSWTFDHIIVVNGDIAASPGPLYQACDAWWGDPVWPRKWKHIYSLTYVDTGSQLVVATAPICFMPSPGTWAMGIFYLIWGCMVWYLDWLTADRDLKMHVTSMEMANSDQKGTQKAWQGHGLCCLMLCRYKTAGLGISHYFIKLFYQM